jgi:hypothetical protein
MAGYSVAAAQASLGQEIWCGNTATPKCPADPSVKGVPCPGNKSETCGDAWALEIIEFTCKVRTFPAFVQFKACQSHGSAAVHAPHDLVRAQFEPTASECPQGSNQSRARIDSGPLSACQKQAVAPKEHLFIAWMVLSWSYR